MALWADIREGIAHLAALDQGFVAPGSRRHRYALRPCVERRDLDAWEAEAGHHLPDELRAYYAGCADGGAGPLRGMRPLAELRVRPGPDGPLFDALITGTGVAWCLDARGAFVELPEDGRARLPHSLATLFETWIETETRRFEAVKRLFATARTLDDLIAQGEAALGPYPVADYMASFCGAPRPEGLFGADGMTRNWSRQHGWYEETFRRYKARSLFRDGAGAVFLGGTPRRRLSKG